MKKINTTLAALLISCNGAAWAHDDHGEHDTPSMKQQAHDDWREIRDTAGEAAATTAEWGKSVGRKAAELGKEAAEQAKVLGKKAHKKANELTEQARHASQKEEPSEEPPGSRFFY